MEKLTDTALMDALLLKYKDKIRFAGPKHDKINQVKALIANTKPNPEKLFVAEGIWSHTKIIDLNIHVRSFIFCPQLIYNAQTAVIAETMLQRAEDVYTVSDKVFMKMSERDRADGLLAICRFPQYDVDSLTLEREALVVVIDGCEIPGNVGTIARTCDGANVDAIFLCNKRVRLTHPKIIKGSMGGAFTIPFIEFDTVSACREWLEKKSFTVYMADTRAEKSYFDHNYASRTALIVGSEKYGISREWYTDKSQLLSIPMMGICDSLNVGVAASIILYDMSIKIGKTKNRSYV